jgi:uncharacterized protein with ATP-grasp and redox domains
VGSLATRTIQDVSDHLIESAEHYKGIKARNNRIALDALPPAEEFIAKAKIPAERFERACSLAAAGNIAPLKAPSEAFRFQEVEDIINGKRAMPVISEEIFKIAQRAGRVLYLTDNAGEIGFDTLLISQLMELGARVTLAVKAGPLFEDATLEDAHFFSIDKMVDDILGVEGFFVPSESPTQLLDAFNRSGLIVCKGTGNFEGLEGETGGKPTVFMLKVKCRVISKKLQAEMGEIVVRLDSAGR